MSLSSFASVIALVLSVCLCGATPAQSQASRPGAGILERGRYLVEVVAFCGACHTSRDAQGQIVPTMVLAGGRIFEERGFRAVASNITQDPDTGIGRWTDDQIANAIRNGRRPDGSLIGPPMPVEAYRGISDADLAAIVVYLRTVAPVRHAVSERSYYPFDLTPHGPEVAHVADPPVDDAIRRGEYLAVNIAHCMDCHSAQLSEGRRDKSKPGATGLVLEGPWGLVVARNISGHPELGLGQWTNDQVRDAIIRGVSADGRRLAPPMGGRATTWARISARDLDDIVAYIRSLPSQDP